MKIQVWSDIVCPFCYAGEKQLEDAVRELGLEDEVEIEIRSFQLNPDAEEVSSHSVYENLAKSYQTTTEQAKQMYAQILQVINNAGLEANMDIAVDANTLKAHRMYHLAKSKSLALGRDFFFDAQVGYYLNGKVVSDDAFLKETAVSLGIPEDEVEEVLQSDKYLEDVKVDIQEARQLGVQSVPTFVSESMHGVAGAIGVEALKKFILDEKERTSGN